MTGLDKNRATSQHGFYFLLYSIHHYTKEKNILRLQAVQRSFLAEEIQTIEISYSIMCMKKNY